MDMHIEEVTSEKEKEAKEYAAREWNECGKKNGYAHNVKMYAFAAYVDNKIIGYMALRIDGGAAYLQQLIVSDAAKKNGVGTALLKKFESFARQNKCHLAYLETHEKNVAALSLYKSNGYTIAATLENNRFHFTWYILSKELKDE